MGGARVGSVCVPLGSARVNTHPLTTDLQSGAAHSPELGGAGLVSPDRVSEGVTSRD
jgi:hypothetical protein